MDILYGNLTKKDTLIGRVYEAASDIISNEGFERLSIRNVAQRTDCTVSEINNYFKDSSEIASYIAYENYIMLYFQIKVLEIENQPPDVSLRSGLTDLIRFMTDNFHRNNAVRFNNISLLDNFTEQQSLISYENIIDIFSKIIDDGIKQGIFKESDPVTLAKYLMIACFGLISSIHSYDNNEKMIDKTIERYVDLLINGILIHN